MKKILVLFIVLAISQLFAGKKEAWVDNPKKLYPESDFLVAVGSGDSLAAAQSRAAAALASTIKVTVKSELDLSLRYDELKKNGVVSSTVEKSSTSDKTNLKADETLIGLSYGETCVDETGRTYAIAFLDRKKTASFYKELIDKDSASAIDFFNSAKKEVPVMKRYAMLTAAAAIAGNSAKLMEQLLVINKGAYQAIKLPYKYDDIKKSFRETAAEMPFTISWTGEKDGKIDDIITESLTGAGFVVKNDGAVTISAERKFEKVDLKNNYNNIKWDVSLKITGRDGTTVASVKESSRISAMSESDAVNRSYIDIKKVVTKKLLSALNSYFTGLLK